MFRPGLIETPEKLIKSCISSMELLSYSNDRITFRTVSGMERFAFVSSADPAMNELKKQGAAERKNGLLELSVFENVLRVRYCEGDALPAENLPLVCRMPDGSSRQISANEDDDAFFFSNGKFDLSFNKKNGGINLSCGNCSLELGGEEKNYFYHWDALGTGVCRIAETGEPLAVEKISLSCNEFIYGFGEQFGKLDKNGSVVDLDISDALGVTSPRCYKSVPFFMSSRGFGMFFNDSCRMRFDVGNRSKCDIQAVLDSDHLDYFIFFGPLPEILKEYTLLTGRASMLPDWSFGFWQSKLSYKSADEILEITRKMHEEDIPCDVVHLDTFYFKHDWLCDLEFDRERFPYDGKWIEELHKRNIHLSVWQIPYLPEGTRLFDRLKAAGGFVLDASGEVYNIGFCLAEDFSGGVVGIVDYTNPAAIEIMDEEFGRLMQNHGVEVIKTDFGESIPDDVVFYNGMTGKEMHNLYPFFYNQTVSRITQKYTSSSIVWGRSAWAGNQRFPLQWGGDNSSNFANMLPQLAGGLSLGMCGFTFWSCDIGGFLGKMGGKLLVRWLQLGGFLSHCRVHGYGDRELYKLPQKEKEMCRAALKLRYRLLPYILQQSQESAASGLPVLRAMALEFWDDPNTGSLCDQYMFGSGMMIAPLLTESDERKVYFPAGRWVDFFTGEEICGPVWKNCYCPPEHTLVYLREGAVIPQTEPGVTVGETLAGDWYYTICKRTVPGTSCSGNMQYCYDGTEHRFTVEGKDVDAEYL